MLLPNGLKLFISDIIDTETNKQTFWYIVGKTYNSALERFIKEANKIWHGYSYYFYEANEDIMEEFMERYTDIKEDIYYK